MGSVFTNVGRDALGQNVKERLEFDTVKDISNFQQIPIRRLHMKRSHEYQSAKRENRIQALTTTSIIMLPFAPANPLNPAEYNNCDTTVL